MKQTALTVCLCLAVVTTLGCVHGMPPRSEIPSDAPQHVSDGIRLLYSISAQSRAQGCLNLGMLGSKSAPAIPFLIPLLSDEAMAWSPSIFIPYTGTAVGNEAADALALIGSPAVTPLIVALKNDVPAVRARAARCLGQIGDIQSIDALLIATVDHDVGVQAAAKWALAGMPDSRAIPYTLSVLQKHQKGIYASREIAALGEIGPAARETAPLLWTIFRDEKDSNRWLAATALGKIEQGGPIVAELLELAKDHSLHSYSFEAMDALGRIGPYARQAVPDLKRLLSVDYTACKAAIALWRITSDSSVCLETLTTYCVNDYDSCACLAEMGPAAAPAVPALIEALRSPHGAKWGAARALGRIGPKAKEAVPALCECLKDKDSYGVRGEAAKALGRIGGEARSSIQALKKLLRDDFLEVRIAAEDALELLQASTQETGKR